MSGIWEARQGEGWEQRLHERLRWADAVVCVVTSSAVASPWCAAEISFALSRGSRVLPVRAERGVDHPLLRSLQYADLTTDSSMARAALIQELRRVDVGGGWGWPDDRSPFPGLRPFGAEEHRVFFGRDGEVQQLAELVRSPAERAEGAVLLVVGPSGCGKSSLARAGLGHVMAQEPGWWTLAPMLPGTDPVAGLVRQLAAAAQRLGLGWSVAQVRHQLDDTGLAGLADELLLTARAQRLLLVVDQFEELLSQASPGQRARFAQLLRPVLGGPVQVVATLRPEFLDQLLLDTDLAVLPTRHYPLRPLCREALRSVIQGPAQLAGIDVDDELVTRLVADADSGEALPLLAFTLAQLAEGVGRGGHLSAARYEQLEGVRGALTRQADAALAGASEATGRRREEVIAGLLRLVTVDEQGRAIRWRVPRAQLPEPVTRELDVFVARRLLITDTDHSHVVVGVAHEAFLSAWPPLAQAIDDNASALRARRVVEQAATEWNDNGHPPTRLWERGQLAAALADTGAQIQDHDVVACRVDLSSTARAFLRASIRRDRLRRGRAITVLSVLLVLALAAAGIAFAQQRAVKYQRNVALSRQLAGRATELRATDPALAAQLALAAFRLVLTPEARGSVLSTFATPYRPPGNTNAVKSVAFSPDGRILATTTSGDNTARLWNVRDPHQSHPLSPLTGHTGSVFPVAFSPDGRTLATGSADKTARLWDVRDPYQPHLLSTFAGHPKTPFLSVAFSPDGRTLATGSYDSAVRLWDVSDSRQPRLRTPLIGHIYPVNSVAFSPDGRTLATASEDSTVHLWDVRDLRQPHPLSILTVHAEAVNSVAFSPDGRTLATGSDDHTARLWDVRNPHQPHLLTALTDLGEVLSVAFSSDRRTLASASADGTVRLWDVRNPRQPHPLGTLTGHNGPVRSVAFSPDGHTLATASLDGTAWLWDVRDPLQPHPLGTLTRRSGDGGLAPRPDGDTLATASSGGTTRLSGFPEPVVVGHNNVVYSVAFSPDGRTLATGSFDQTTRLWDVSNRYQVRLLGTLPGRGGVAAVAFSPDGRTLATGSADNAVHLWDVRDPREPHPLSTLLGHTNPVYSVAFSPDGRTLATGSSDSTARLWDVRDPLQPHPLSILPGHTGHVRSVAFSPDGHTLATGSYDSTAPSWNSTARLWDVSNPRQPHPLSTLPGGGVSVAFSPDGRTLATANLDGTARLWDVSDPRQPLSTLTGTGIVISVAFSPDRHTLATGNSDNTVRLWDVRNPRQPMPLGALTGHIRPVFSVAFSPDGRALATGSEDNTARLWETAIDRIIDRICRVTPDITQSKWEQYLPDLPYRPPCHEITSN